VDGGPKRVFVTGALGSIGRAIADRYRELGAEVTGVDLRADRRLGVVAADLAEAGRWQERARGADLVVHTAAAVSFTGADLWRSNVLATRNAVAAAAAAGARLLHFSSVTVFSFDFPDGADESHPVRPSGVPYADTKIASEQVVLQAHAAGEVEGTIVRPGDVYGPGARAWTVIPVEEIKARRLLLPAMGRGIFSPLFIDNLVDGVILAAASTSTTGRIYILTDGAGVETREFFGHYHRMLERGRPWVAPTPVARGLARIAAAVARASGSDSEVGPTAVDYLCRPGTYSIARAREELGYEPAVDLEEGMRRTRDWLAAAGLLS
jgi:nucleoside-diphosphate-sugar epimerase